MTPFQILMKHREIILPIHQEQGSIPKTYQKILVLLPELKDIKFNTFKQYMPRLIEIAEQLAEESKVLTQEKIELEQALQNLQNKTDESDEIQPGEKIKVDGWNIVKGNDGYFRANRKINRKVVSVYLGKKFDEGRAMEKIRAKVEKMSMA
ncbi:MAG: hypothetical protein OMM_10958 [Candidatus Magnetoglobus multicellularis str. Araruama]|uniref:Uncharacterized protein n=1 Tax=Candidatus Magnetoglobus multicellularis str. Araruama TaxID=890399 RepID=A0A1V1NZI0_9BACT|nr:MAG: hypothetical protein OMM_10958 [Candidatus Magnetoglobus multicellularis str. Araruama]